MLTCIANRSVSHSTQRSAEARTSMCTDMQNSPKYTCYG
jgi:hypothetical protein